MTGFTDRDVPDQTGKCFVITGANTGLGFEAAKVLAGKGARVLMACRSADRAEAAIKSISAETPQAELGFVPLDLADLESVKAAAAQLAAEPRIDCLINNAGISFAPLGRTAQGREMQFGVNHLGHFALVGHLWRKLAEQPGTRIVLTASLAHRLGKIAWDDLDAVHGYNRYQRYMDSKLANLLHLAELQRRFALAGAAIDVMACHPGMAETELTRHSQFIKVANPLVGALFNTAAQGAWATLQAACDPAARSGDYFGPNGFAEVSGPSRLANRSKRARDPALARKLWEVSVELSGVDPGLPGD
jgi:NAD(P)-dependent dehydrogenase (short-subunit alcohol dehydrogenase family)